ncbi:Mg/Co/Ni transporter MgtE / CBS domain [Vibrio variabilis]|uniref:Mg/Co/Ni transporter MgtE / CBS domain n=1 Tax=Vibrio variabilis TaxID=990271 RepID=A0ABQ0JAH8_9VIBR|nr:Mg/Co/Ni transporter MgtE / CBS domain [Vibrio variabilis]
MTLNIQELEDYKYTRDFQDKKIDEFIEASDSEQLLFLIDNDIELGVFVLQHCPHGQVQHLLEKLEMLGHDKRVRYIAMQLGIIHSEAETNLDYLTTSVKEHVLQRIGWIVTLALLGIVSGLIIAQYEDTLSTLVLLAVYMPVIAAAGGNTGSQAATLVIRALATGELRKQQWMQVVYKELRVGILIAGTLALIIAARVLVFSGETSYAGFALGDIALAISVALFIQVVISTVLGGVLPIIARVFKLDPAVLVSPMLASIVDISGIWIYFTVVSHYLGIR